MLGGPSEAVEGTAEEPVLITIESRVARRWSNDAGFIVRENSIAECVLTVALLEDTFSFGGHDRQKAE